MVSNRGYPLIDTLEFCDIVWQETSSFRSTDLQGGSGEKPDEIALGDPRSKGRRTVFCVYLGLFRSRVPRFVVHAGHGRGACSALV